MKKLLEKSLDYLGAKAPECRLCGRPAYPAAAAADRHSMPAVPGVCRECSAAIPWITAIQCPVCGRADRCFDCARRRHTFFICNRSAVRYDAAMKKLFAQYKYRGQERLKAPLGDMLLLACRELTQEILLREGSAISGGSWAKAMRMRPVSPFGSRDAVMFQAVWDAVTFVPISAERAEERGFNQAERLAAYLAERCGLRIIPLLSRTRHSAKQSFKTRTERLRDTRALFNPDPAGLAALFRLGRERSGGAFYGPMRPLRILLVDDIYTTGSTVNACAETLSSPMPCVLEIYTLTWARS
jgi:predicted amidophosphoribosyltransferase